MEELKRICQLFTTISVPARHNLVCVEFDLSSLERPGLHRASSDLSAVDVSALAGDDEGGTASAVDALERVIAETRAECFRFGGERWTCRLSLNMEESDEPSGSTSQLSAAPSIVVHVARVESELNAEPPGWFHILSAQSQLILPKRECIGPLINGVIALGKVPAGLQMHVDIPEVKITWGELWFR